MKKIVVTLILLIAYSYNFAQIELSLSDAIQKGLKNNYEIKVQYNAQKIAKRNNTWGTAGALPSLNFNLSPEINHTSRSSKFDKEDKNGNFIEEVDTTNTSQTLNLGIGLSLNWTLFDGYKMFINKRKFGIIENLSTGNTRFLVENTIQSTILSYYNVLLEKEKLKIYRKTTQLSKDRFDYDKQKMALGNSSSYEMLQSKISYLTDKTNFLQQKQKYEISLRDLSFIIGEKDSIFSPTDSLIVPTTNYNLGSLLQKLTEDNINLKNQYLNIKIKEEDEKLAYSRLYPTVNFTSNARYSMNQTSNDDTELPSVNSLYVGVGLSINYNIFNGFNDKNRIAIAKINKEIENIKLSKIEHELTNSLLKLYDQYLLKQEMFNITKSRNEAAELSLELSKERYKRAVINSFNYRDVQLQYLNSALAELQAIYGLISTNVKILKITGGIVANN